MNDPVPSPVRALLDVYAAELPEVRFPDVDLDVLKTTLSELEAKTEAVAQAEAALAEAKKTQLESFESLLAKSRRALAYAKVFAEDKPELMAKLDAIGLKVPKAIGQKREDDKPRRGESKDGDDAPRAPATRALLMQTDDTTQSEVVMDEGEAEHAPKKRGRPAGKKNGQNGHARDAETPEAQA